MKPLLRSQVRALHRMIEVASAARRDMSGPILKEFESTLKEAKGAMEQVHIQQVYLTKQNADDPMVAQGLKSG